MQRSNYPPPCPFQQGYPVYPEAPPPGGILGPPVALAVLPSPNPQGMTIRGSGTAMYQQVPLGKYLPQTVGFQTPLGPYSMGPPGRVYAPSGSYSMGPPGRVYGPSDSYFIFPQRIPRNDRVGAIPYPTWNPNEVQIPPLQPPRLPSIASHPDSARAKDAWAEAELNPKRKEVQWLNISSAAEIGYSLSPVHKRLKCPVLNSKKAVRRSQGRPFASSVIGRFVLHHSLASIVKDLIRRKKCALLCYNFTEIGNSPSRSPNAPLSTKSASPTATKNRKLGPFEFEQFNLDFLVSDDPVVAFDTYFGSKHCAIKLIDCSGGMQSSSQSMIRHNPLVEANATVGNSGHVSNEVESSGISKSKDGPHFHPRDGKYANPACERNTIDMNFHMYIVEAFGIEKYQFIRTIRDANGHILKVETIRPPRNSNNEIEFTAEWLKRSACYPRYKSGIKIQLISDDQSFVLYNSWKMILWDIKQKRRGEELKNFLSSSTKKELFGGRMVYVKI
ncbi:DEKNAAC104177 [Brettanomyces naardenensis]|uniref:DEKNAAC104177 n=1 Tax=Brettanomyces naardenensis TaxID=13370 RepID=A0A448YQC1_BRENA|nr:DEKNAAC104177 [Brettanomyces naardenensis]